MLYWRSKSIKNYIDEQIKYRDMLYDQRFLNDKHTLEAALHANDVRLSGMNEFREALNDSALRNMTRVETETSLRLLSDRFEADIKPLQQKIADSGKPNWAVISVSLSLIAGLVAVVWLLINLQIQNAETPIALNVSQLREQHTAREHLDAQTSISINERLRLIEQQVSASGQADAQSRIDRDQINQRVRTLEGTLASEAADRRTQHATLDAKMTEVETQFCGADIVRNLMHANDLRIFSMLWQKQFPDALYPVNNSYYPRVCNRREQ